MKEIQLTRGFVAAVDDDLYDLLNQRKWQASVSRTTVYARCRMVMESGRVIYPYMHQVVLGSHLHGKEVDHKDNCGLNNQRENLRFASHIENQHNKQQHTGKAARKGVHWNKSLGKWIAQISARGERRSLGCFDSESDAYDAYCNAAKEMHGEFANVQTASIARTAISPGQIAKSRRTYNRKLDESQRAEAAALIARGASLRSVSRHFSVSLPTILRINRELGLRVTNY